MNRLQDIRDKAEIKALEEAYDQFHSWRRVALHFNCKYRTLMHRLKLLGLQNKTHHTLVYLERRNEPQAQTPR